ncbi:MAG: hypothetical protein OCC46_16475 [Pseudodesulfovibrio sp.]
MKTYSEGVYMSEICIRDVVYAQICRLLTLIEKVWRHRDEVAARKKLAALSPWLKNDLGIGQDGRPLDRRI